MNRKRRGLTPEQELAGIRELQNRQDAILLFASRVAATLGILSVIASVAIWVSERSPLPRLSTFVAISFGVIALTRLFASARLRTRPIVGAAAAEVVMQTFLPFWIVTAFVSTLIVIHGDDKDALALAVIWISAHGLSLVAQRLVFPWQIVAMGWIFILAGCAVMTLPLTALSLVFNEPLCSAVVIGSTFGAIHLVFAIATWRPKASRRAEAAQAAEPTAADTKSAVQHGSRPFSP